MSTNSIKLLTGNSHPGLAQAVAKRCVVLKDPIEKSRPSGIALLLEMFHMLGQYNLTYQTAQARYRTREDYGVAVFKSRNERNNR